MYICDTGNNINNDEHLLIIIIFTKKRFFLMVCCFSEKTKAPAASLKRRRCGLGIPTHRTISFILINMSSLTVHMRINIPYWYEIDELYCPCCCPFLGIAYCLFNPKALSSVSPRRCTAIFSLISSSSAASSARWLVRCA